MMGLNWACAGGLVYILMGLGVCNGGIASSFVRKKDTIGLDMPLDSDVFKVPPGYNAPQQVHITQGDHKGKGVIISWINPEEPGSYEVLYWAENSKVKNIAVGTIVTYKYYNYTSGYIHHCTIKHLMSDTKYYYEVGLGNASRQFWFITPPKDGPDVPYTFGLIGDLGQTFDSNRTLTHYELNPVKDQALLFVGDLSYADCYPHHDNTRWDTWGRFIERSAAYQPWIWAAGNHEIDFVPEIGESKPFKPYKHRFLCHMKHHIVHLLSGTRSRELQRISLSCLLTLLMVTSLVGIISSILTFEKKNAYPVIRKKFLLTMKNCDQVHCSIGSGSMPLNANRGTVRKKDFNDHFYSY